MSAAAAAAEAARPNCCEPLCVLLLGAFGDCHACLEWGQGHSVGGSVTAAALTSSFHQRLSCGCDSPPHS